MADFAPELILYFSIKETSAATEKGQTLQLTSFNKCKEISRTLSPLWSSPHNKINEVELNHSQDRFYSGVITNN